MYYLNYIKIRTSLRIWCEYNSRVLRSNAPSYATIVKWKKCFLERMENINDHSRPDRLLFKHTDGNIELKHHPRLSKNEQSYSIIGMAHLLLLISVKL